MRIKNFLVVATKVYFVFSLIIWINLMYRKQQTTDAIESNGYEPKFCKPVDYNFMLHTDEEAFPLAFSMQIYRDFDRALRLIHAIYRPHNCYCIHIDAKVESTIRVNFEAEIKEQYGTNVYLVPESESLFIKWGTISTLDADLLCSRRLLDRCSGWKYWINLTGQEFPLRTNWELVTALKLFNGSNVIDHWMPKGWIQKYHNRFPLHVHLGFPLQWNKQGAHVALSREFVHFVHHNDRAKLVLQLLRKFEHETNVPMVPDETYFPTLNYNSVTLGFPVSVYVDGSILRYKIWNNEEHKCISGQWAREICILGVGDVPLLMHSPQFFANKFFSTVEPIGYSILEQWLAGRVQYERDHGKLHPSFNETIYRSLRRWTAQ